MLVYKVTDRSEQIREEYNFIAESNVEVVANRLDGLLVFGPRGLKNQIGLCYYNQSTPEIRYKTENGYYNIMNKRFSVERLVFLCFYFGRYDTATGDYIITGKSYINKK